MIRAYIVLLSLGLLSVQACHLLTGGPIFKGIPQHVLYVNTNTAWEAFTIDTSYLKKMGKEANDTMVILTKDKMILVTGQYGWRPDDSIIMPYSGEFGIRFEILDNSKYKFSDTLISVGGNKFRKNNMAEFQWWAEALPAMKCLGKGEVIVSGP